MSTTQVYESEEQVYAVRFRTAEAPRTTKRRQPSHSRSGSRPQMFNGIHRRRSKKIRW